MASPTPLSQSSCQKCVSQSSNATERSRGAEVSTLQEWHEKVVQFDQRWNFHHAVGLLDGKHVAIRCPQQSGSIYYNYNDFYSVVILALVDADYRCLWVDVRSNGSCFDAQIVNECHLKKSIVDGTIGFPDADELQGDDRDTTYFIVADDVFALSTWFKAFFRQKS